MTLQTMTEYDCLRLSTAGDEKYMNQAFGSILFSIGETKMIQI